MKNFATTFLATLIAAGVALFAYEAYREHREQQEIVEAEQSKQAYINAAYLAQGLGALSQLKPHIAMYWHELGKLPCDADDLHLPTELIARQTPSVSEVALSDCGALTATYTEVSGFAGGTLTLRASEIATATDRGLAWECTTPDYPEIGLHMPGCRYQPQGQDEAPLVHAAQRPAAAEVSQHDPATEATSDDCRNGAELHRSVFTDSVVDRSAGKRFVELGPSDSKILFFTEIIGAAGRKVVHRWLLNDMQIAEVPFEVQGDRWRTWSSKRLISSEPGTLRVEVLDGNCLIGQESIPIEAESRLDPANLPG